jgi:hypothetical protein
MGSSVGFVILPRDEFDHPFFDDFWNRAAWTELLMRARGIANDRLARGQLEGSYRDFARLLKVTEDRVRKFLRRLVELGKIAIDVAATKHSAAIYRVVDFARYNGEKAKNTNVSKGAVKSATQAATPMLFETQGVKNNSATQTATQQVTVDETRARLIDNGKTTLGKESSSPKPSSPSGLDDEFRKREKTVVSTPIAESEVDRLTTRVVEKFGLESGSARDVVLLGLLRSQARQRIHSAEYFRTIVEELRSQPLPNLYAHYLEFKLRQLRGVVEARTYAAAVDARGP